jgi:hypothetical protein
MKQTPAVACRGELRRPPHPTTTLSKLYLLRLLGADRQKILLPLLAWQAMCVVCTYYNL